MEVSALVELGPSLTPIVIRHARLGLEWTVLEVSENWMTPRYRDTVGTPGETRRFKVRALGPLPGCPSEDGEVVLLVRRYGDRPGWWVSPAHAGP